MQKIHEQNIKNLNEDSLLLICFNCPPTPPPLFCNRIVISDQPSVLE